MDEYRRFSICPVNVGDKFYHKKPNMTLPDMLEVIQIMKQDNHWLIQAKYLYHTIGPQLERVFSDMIFQDPDWIIVRRGESYDS